MARMTICCHDTRIDNMLSMEGVPMSQPAGDPGELALLVADVFEAAGVLRRYGERTAATAGQTQARWQLLSVVSENLHTASRF